MNSYRNEGGPELRGKGSVSIGESNTMTQNSSDFGISPTQSYPGSILCFIE